MMAAPAHLHKRQHLPPLTLIPYSTATPSSSSSVVIFIFIAVFTTVCFSSSSTFAHAKVISSPLSTSSSYAKSISCFQSCRDPHKECSVDGKCVCKPYFDYIPERDICLKSFGASCTNFEASDEELCNTDKFLSCDDTGTCSCHRERDSLLIYDPNLETCVAPPGHECEFGISYMNVKKECVQNAQCVPDPRILVDTEYYGICECSQGFVAKGEKCVPEIGSKCELDGDCDQDGMRCLEGECRCSEDRVYSEKEYECKLKVGAVCEVAIRDCVENAECLERRDEKLQWKYKCGCQLGYQEVVHNGTCVLDGHGLCKDSKIYDEQRGRCSLKVGASCLPTGVNLCVKHAFCGTGNKCQCFDAYDMTVNGTCKKIEKMIENDTSIDKDTRQYSEMSESSTRKMESPQTHELRDDGQKGTSNPVNSNKVMIILGGIYAVLVWRLYSF